MTIAAIDVEEVSVRYGDVMALDRVSLSIEPGRVCGLVGMNGAGKSTLLKVIVAMLHPDQGSVKIVGKDPQRARREGLVSYVPQSEEVDWAFPLSVRDVVMMGRYGHQGFTRRSSLIDRDIVRSALLRVGIGHLADRQIGQLSGGQRKRAFVARGVAQEAPVLLLDEPFAGVDRDSEATIADLLRQLAATGHTIFVSTHNLQALTELCDEVILLRQRVIAHASPADALRSENLALAFGIDSVREVDL